MSTDTNLGHRSSGLSNDLLNCVEKDAKSVKLKGPQSTTQVLAKVFGLYPDTFLLLSDDGYVECQMRRQVR